MPGEENILEKTEESVKKLPPWAIVAGVVIIGGVAYLLLFKPSAGSSGNAPILPAVGGSDGGGGSSSIGTPLPTTPLTTNNNDWLTNAISQVSAATGIDPYLVNVYLTQYLSGTSPSSNANAQTQFQKVINSALQLFGSPPVPITSNPTGGSFFKTASDWLSAGLSDLGVGNYNQDYATEISQFLSGQTTTLSQGAYNLYQQISGNLGNAPGAGLPIVGATTTPAAQPITQTMVDSWQNLYNSLIASTPGGSANATAASAFSSWTQSLNLAIPTLSSSLSSAQLANAFNLINQSLAQPNSPFKDQNYVLSWVNSLVTNPSILGTSTPSTLYLYNGTPTLKTSTYSTGAPPPVKTK